VELLFAGHARGWQQHALEKMGVQHCSWIEHVQQIRRRLAVKQGSPETSTDVARPPAGVEAPCWGPLLASDGFLMLFAADGRLELRKRDLIFGESKAPKESLFTGACHIIPTTLLLLSVLFTHMRSCVFLEAGCLKMEAAPCHVI
jgi:hypothetical protein